MLSSLSILQQFSSPKFLVDLATIYGNGAGAVHQREHFQIGTNPSVAAVPFDWPTKRGHFPFLSNSFQFINESSTFVPASAHKLRIISEEEGEAEEKEEGKKSENQEVGKESSIVWSSVDGDQNSPQPNSVPFKELEEEERRGRTRRGEEEAEEGNSPAVNVIELEEPAAEQQGQRDVLGQQQIETKSGSAELANIGTGNGTGGRGGEEGNDGANLRRTIPSGTTTAHHHPHLCQLSPAASICVEVQRVSIEDRPHSAGDETMGGGQHQKLVKKSSPESGRERAGRLKKHAAVEDEEHLSLGPLDPQSTAQQHPLVVPALHVSPLAMLSPSQQSQPSSSSIPSVSPLIAAEQHFALAAAAAAAAASRPSPQSSGGASSQLDSSTAAAIQLALLQQCHRQQQQLPPTIPGTGATIKHEPISREELLSNLQQQANREQLLAAANCPPWLMGTAVAQQQQQQQQTIGGMSNALLTALIQQQQNQAAADSVMSTRAAAETSSLLIEQQTNRGLAAIQEEHLHLQHQQAQQQHATEIAHLFEAGRNQSTESTASTNGGGSLPSGAAAGIGTADTIPRKQDIQTDIRMNRGRFQLVRKRGRSEVWNLFGQVVDTLTGARLPYVACYACKVLYTDTGGGTGNMTRHRCSMGSSYRSNVRRSSSDTTVGNESLSINQSSSFESIGGGGAMGQSGGGGSFGATSPPYEGGGQSIGAATAQMLLAAVGGVPPSSQEHQAKVWNVTAGARQAFAESASSGFLSGSTTSSSMPFGISASNTSMDTTPVPSHPPHQQLTVNLGPYPSSTSSVMAPFLSGGGGSVSAGPAASAFSPATSSSAASLHPPHSHGLLSTLSPSPAISSSIAPSASSAPSSILIRPTTILAQGHHFTPADKSIFAQAVMQFCAQDMHNWDVVEGEGFKNLVETILFIGRRSHGDPAANVYDPVRQLIPSAKQLKEVFAHQENAVLKATAHDLEQIKAVGLALNCQTLQFAGEKHYAISVNYITDDWRITRRSLRVEKIQENRKLDQLISDVLTQFQLNESTTKLILLSMDSETEEMNSSLEGNESTIIQPLANANRALNKILAKSLAECPDTVQIMALIRQCSRIISTLSLADRLGQFPQADYLERNQQQQSSSFDFTNWVYPTIKFIKENCAEIQHFLEVEGINAEEECLKGINWQMLTELELFLEPFHEMTQIFTDSKQPHFQRILPEWFALIHECQSSGQQSLDESTPSNSREECGETMDTTMNTSAPTMTMAAGIGSGTPNWIRQVRQVANQHLKEWAQTNIRLEHRAATVLNPRLRHLPLICSDAERAAVYERIRELIGLSKPKRGGSSGDNGGSEIGAGMKSEPFKKRRRFLDRLEDCAMEEEDELDLYLRTTFVPDQTRDILEFWSSIGESKFPRLSKLARFLLAASGAPSPVQMQQRSAGLLEPNEIGTLLNLRPEVLNSVNQQLAQHRARERHQQQHHS